MKFEFSRESFEKYADIKFNQTPSSGSRFSSIWADRQTNRRKGRQKDRQKGRYEEANNRISQFFYTPKIVQVF
jgi:hypothetical protein